METLQVLNGYLEKIKWSGSTSADLDTLKRIIYLHPQFFPFETINPFSGQSVPIDIENIYSKMVKNQRGGYCFEQNILMKIVLEEIGFKTTTLGARVVMNQPPDSLTRRSHMCLLVHLENKDYLVDLGFGGRALNGPIELTPGLIQDTPIDKYRIIEHEKEEFLLQVLVKTKWRSIYRFDLLPQAAVDLEMYNWYTATNPNSGLVKGLTIVKTNENDDRLTLNNNTFSFYENNNLRKDTVFKTSREILDCIKNEFKIVVENEKALEEAINKKIFTVK